MFSHEKLTWVWNKTKLIVSVVDWVWATLPLVADMVNLKVVFEWGLGQEKNSLPTLPSPPSLLPLLSPWRDQICPRKWKLESLNLQIYNLMVSFLNKLHGSFEGEFWSPLSKSTFEETFLQAISLAFQLYYFCCMGIFFSAYLCPSTLV